MLVAFLLEAERVLPVGVDCLAPVGDVWVGLWTRWLTLLLSSSGERDALACCCIEAGVAVEDALAEAVVFGPAMLTGCVSFLFDCQLSPLMEIQR